jgi:acyl-coenzyme A synthetase/AMP-(fatty) acid ligase
MKKVTPLPEIPVEIPEKTNMAWETVDRPVEEGKGDRTFIYFEDREITYRQLQKLVNKVGNALKKLGISRGDHVLFKAPNSPELLASVLAAMKIGAVAVPSQTLFGDQETEYVISNSESVVIFSAPTVVGMVEAAKSKCPTLRHIVVFGKAQGGQIAFEDFIRDASDKLECADTHRDDVAFILYSSGSMGMPKGVVKGHRDLYSGGIPLSRAAAITPDDVFMHPQEMSYAYMLATMCGAIYGGAKIVLYPGRVEPERVLEYIDKYRITKFASVTSFYRMVLRIEDFDKKYDLSSLQICMCGGEALPASTYEELKKRLGAEIYDVSGQTECAVFCCNRPNVPVRAGSMGKTYPGVDLAVIDEDGNRCPPNMVGHLVLKEDCPALLLAYQNTPEKWTEVHRFPGWYDTGDLAYIDEDGYFYHGGRADDMINSRGYLISPQEIEETILNEVPEVLEAAAVPAPDPVTAERVKVFLTLRPGNKPSKELAEKVRERTKKKIAPYKVPKDIEFVNELPKTVSGKVLRRELKALEKERAEKGETAGFHFS